MRQTAWHKPVTALAALTLLNGCVAAALPVVAGGVLATRDVIEEGSERDQSEGALAAQAEPDEAIAVGDRNALSVIEGPLEEAGASGANLDLSSPFSSFVSYASTQSLSAAISDEDLSEAPKSAMLVDPASLDGERTTCSGGTPTVLMDLDPADGLFQPDKAITADPALKRGLASLRAEGVQIAWISGVAASEAGRVRKALTRSGLDQHGTDATLLMRYKADRKQTRRADLAKTSCIIAIAGDTRKDFDELYEYLLEPGAAFGLEKLINNGWFLTPPALSQN